MTQRAEFNLIRISRQYTALKLKLLTGHLPLSCLVVWCSGPDISCNGWSKTRTRRAGRRATRCALAIDDPFEMM